MKLKISKIAINNCLNDYKNNMNMHSDNSNKKSKTKNKSFIYNRKRNCSYGNNNIYNSSNNKSKDSNNKDSSNNYHTSLNKTIQNIQSIQSAERNKIINKQKNKIVNTHTNSINNININNSNIMLSKLNEKNKGINDHPKKLKPTIIQNFSRYKKKSILNMNNMNYGYNEYFNNDQMKFIMK